VLLFLSLWAGPAFAEEVEVELVSVPIAEMDAPAYNDALLQLQEQLMTDLIAASQAIGNPADLASALDWLKTMAEAMARIATQIEAFPAFEGDDTLRQAVLASVAWCVEIYGTTLVRGAELSFQVEVANKDLAELDALLGGLMADAEAVDDRVRAVQKVFAERHGYLLLDAEEPPLPVAAGPEFEAEGCVPDASVLPCASHVSFASRYDAGVLGLQNEIMAATNGVFEADVDFEKARLAALAGLQTHQAAVDGLEDWQGDSTYVDGLGALFSDLSAALDGPAAIWAPLLDKGPLGKKDAKLANSNATALNDAVGDALAEFDVAMVAFRDRFHITAYFAWAAEQGVE
jgi:hypothetical protein